MTATEISILALAVSCLSAIAAFGRWFATYRQIKVQNFLQLSNYLHQTEYRDARHRVRTARRGEVDPEALRKLCSSFDFAGLFVYKKLVDKSMFLDYWGNLFAFLADHISDDLTKPAFGKMKTHDYYRYFYWLLREGAKHPAKYQASIE